MTGTIGEVKTYENYVDGWDGFIEKTLDRMEDTVVETENDRKAQDETK